MDPRPVHALEAALLTGHWSQALRVTPPAAVLLGQAVTAGATLGSRIIPGPLYLVEIATPLGLDPADLSAALRVTPGQQVERDEVLAQHRGGWRRRTVLAPCAGTVQGIAEGCLLLRALPRHRAVTAPLTGVIAALANDGEITLQLSGTRLQGAWASGGEGTGRLVIATAAHEALGWQQVARQLAGAILVGGRLEDARAVRRARQFGLAGLVVGGIAPALASGRAWGLPLLATSGLGDQPMAAAALAALAKLAGQTAHLDASADSPYLAVAHAVSAAAATAKPAPGLIVGAMVRLTRMPFQGQCGEIVDIPAVARRTALGALCEGALIALPNGQRVFAPWANIDPVA